MTFLFNNFFLVTLGNSSSFPPSLTFVNNFPDALTMTTITKIGQHFSKETGSSLFLTGLLMLIFTVISVLRNSKYDNIAIIKRNQRNFHDETGLSRNQFICRNFRGDSCVQ